MTLVRAEHDPVPDIPRSQLVRRAGRDPEWLVNQLPATMAGASFFSRFVSIFQDVGGRLLDHADHVDHVVDVSIAPPELVRWLGSWVGVSTLDDSQAVGLQRRIVSSAARTLRSRGTRAGLVEFLALLTGHPVGVEDGGGIFGADGSPADPAWVRIWVRELGVRPDEAADNGTDSTHDTTDPAAVAARQQDEESRDLVEFVTVLRDEIPAHVRAELYVAGTLRWTSDKGIQR